MQTIETTSTLLTPASASSAADARDQHVVEVAAALFLEEGIANIKMTDIADACGLGVATLYRRFGTKTAIVIEAATLLWRSLNAKMLDFVESDAFLALDGLPRLLSLLRCYVDAYVNHSDFVRFLAEFDHLVISGDIPAEELVAYGGEVDSFYIMFEDAYLLGTQDGTIVREVDFPVLYRTVAHAMMGVAEKLVRGEIIPSDDFSSGSKELECIVNLVEMALGPKDVHADA